MSQVSDTYLDKFCKLARAYRDIVEANYKTFHGQPSAKDKEVKDQQLNIEKELTKQLHDMIR